MRPEFSRPYAVERLTAEGATFALEATPEERAALARRFDLAALDRLEATGVVRLLPEKGLIEAEGVVRARLAQRCVVTFEPVPTEVDAGFRRVFTREPPPREIEMEPDDEPPEPLDGAAIDVGEIAAEELAVALDPYPRAPAAESALAGLAPSDDDAAAAANPFAKLSSLRRH